MLGGVGRTGDLFQNILIVLDLLNSIFVEYLVLDEKYVLVILAAFLLLLELNTAVASHGRWLFSYGLVHEEAALLRIIRLAAFAEL